MEENRFNSLKNDCIIKNNRGRQWVDIPKSVKQDSEESELENDLQSDGESDSVSYSEESELENDLQSDCESDSGSHLSNNSDNLDNLDSFTSNIDFNDLTKDAKTTEVSTRRLAALNFDFEEYTLDYLSMVLKSTIPKGGKLKSIAKYPTETYMQRIEDDTKFGPKEFRIEQYSGMECEEDDEGSLSELYRANTQYAISRLSFYIAVFEFDSVETSDAVYGSLDDTNLGDSGLKLDLRYVPDDKTFEIPDQFMDLVQTLRPNSTKFKNTGFKPSCFTQPNYKKTWDETPIERKAFYERAFNVNESDLSDVEDYCGGASQSEFSASDTESEFYTTVDGPVIPKLRRKRIPVNELRSLYGLPANKEDSSEEEEYEGEEEEDNEEEVEDIDDNIEASDNDEYVVDETAEYEGDNSESSDDEKPKEDQNKVASKRKNIKIREKSKLKIKENALKKEKKREDERQYMRERMATTDGFDEFLTDHKYFKVTQTHPEYEDAKFFMEMMLIRAKILNVKPTYTIGNEEDAEDCAKPPRKKRRLMK